MPVNGSQMERRRAYTGPAIWSWGFRPFFFGAGAWACAALAIWLAAFYGLIEPPIGRDAASWHAHEMIFGFAVAAVAGFLLTAVPNWTSRLPVMGAPLALLFGAWLAGRLATLTAGWTGLGPAMAVDVAFLLLLSAVIAREVVSGRNWRNLPVSVVLVLLAVANALDHLAALEILADRALGQRLALALVAVLIALIGGRIVPSFTRNWLKRRGAANLPAEHGLIDRFGIAVVALAAAAWAFRPDHAATGGLMLLAGTATLMRLARWQGWATGPEALVWVLHLGYAWLGVGLCLLGASILWADVPYFAAVHALTAGAVGTMTLAVMTRATLGHTGRELIAGPATTAVYGLVTLAAILRVASGFADPDGILLPASGVAWMAAFGLFVVAYAPLWLRPRPSAS
ncbi:MAG: NnrS family protein [Rhodospirillaceae bacterium]|nr:NnrS family protein [Rhodospirillaceae bacterium]